MYMINSMSRNTAAGTAQVVQKSKTIPFNMLERLRCPFSRIVRNSSVVLKKGLLPFRFCRAEFLVCHQHIAGHSEPEVSSCER